ncbi:MAG: hypothetical protein GWM98_28090, partial [Nitrospinaceae bacterium]|nr:hypothetical protein [Nitrospinaceae bacterium]NIR57609.1 hypothetical protein [Nitrospinaceae bacterium]NIS88083.1 hypothetical protein [Nitrospinaceae bacterium]NIT84947.1 hypothetical protein [Nitrospinaceae bacterium]NIU47119.1 hypothetical protein [Nitrospinaceae bacterium]
VSLVGMGVFTLLIFLFFLFQLSVSLRHVTAVLSRFSGKEGFQSVLGKVDETAHLMSAYYRRYPFRALVSVGYAFLGWVVGLGELY